MARRDKLDEKFADGWKPDEGDEVEGIVEQLSEREGKWGPYPIITIRTAEGPEGGEKLTGDRLAVHGNARALAGQIEAKDPQRGDYIMVRYDGQKVSRDGNNYGDYSLAVWKPGDEDYPDVLRPVLDKAEEADAAAEAKQAAEDEEPF